MTAAGWVWFFLVTWAVAGAVVRVSRNRRQPATAGEKTTGTGRAWQQDAVWDEVFDDLEDE